MKSERRCLGEIDALSLRAHERGSDGGEHEEEQERMSVGSHEALRDEILTRDAEDAGPPIRRESTRPAARLACAPASATTRLTNRVLASAR